MTEYYSKYLKYKNKYLELKNKLKGGAELKIIYANVGVDKNGNPYCDGRNTPARTADQLNLVIDRFHTENMDVLMFCEFCGSALNLLINKLNSIDPTGTIYGLVLLAQKRDNKQYKTQQIKEFKGEYYLSGETYIDNKKEIFVQDKDKRTGKEKPLYNYHPDVNLNMRNESHDFDGYDFNFKFFGYIYRQEVVEFNLEQTLHNLGFGIPIRKITESELHLERIYKNGSIDPDIKTSSSPVNTRPIHMVKLYDFNLDDISESKKVSQNLLQYCGLATFKKISEPQSMVTLLVPHLLGTLELEEDMWIQQVKNIVNKISTLKTENHYVYMMGDFNICPITVWRNEERNKQIGHELIFNSIDRIEGENTLYTNNIEINGQVEFPYNAIGYSAHDIILGTSHNSPVSAAAAVPTAVPTAVPARYVPPAKRDPKLHHDSHNPVPVSTHTDTTRYNAADTVARRSHIVDFPSPNQNTSGQDNYPEVIYVPPPKQKLSVDDKKKFLANINLA